MNQLLPAPLLAQASTTSLTVLSAIVAIGLPVIGFVVLARLLSRARRESDRLIESATAEAQTRAEALNARLSRQIEEAEARIAAARDAAMGALRQVSAETAESLVAKLAGRADRATVDAAVERVLVARGQA